MSMDEIHSDKPVDAETYMILKEREKAWIDLLENFLPNKQQLSDEEILDFLHSIQEYVYLDHPQDRIYNTEMIFKAFNSMASIAHFVTSNELYRRDNDPREYISKNIFLCISYLVKALEK